MPRSARQLASEKAYRARPEYNARRRQLFLVAYRADETFRAQILARSKRYYEAHKEEISAHRAARLAEARQHEDEEWRAKQADGVEVPRHILKRWENAARESEAAISSRPVDNGEAGGHRELCVEDVAETHASKEAGCHRGG